MSNKKYYFAVDLGATSGRTIIGSLEQGKFNIEELTRFDNQLIETGGHFYWDIMALYQEVINGLKLVAQRGINIQSIGIDTWDATSYAWPTMELSCATRWLIATHTPWA